MREFDLVGELMAKIQDGFFVESLQFNTSSYEFIKTYMNSHLAKTMDHGTFLGGYNNFVEEFKDKNLHGNHKLPAYVMSWIGYMLRYWAYVYEVDSKDIYKIIQGRDLEKYCMRYYNRDYDEAIDAIYADRKLQLDKKSLKEQFKDFYGNTIKEL